jgi:hypothetical protein
VGFFPRSESEGGVAGEGREEGVLAGAESGEGQTEGFVILPFLFTAFGRAEPVQSSAGERAGKRSAISSP